MNGWVRGTARHDTTRHGVRAYYRHFAPLPPGSVSQCRKASCIAGSVNNVGQDEILHIGTGWFHSIDSERP